ncbi:MAG: phenylacetate-CoA oxygenase subunit PaaI [Betaproteobacteria bacterium]|nr:phenylacetate-CoA oxygenase subunit PaaI [Betaproteobacteria bacterium]
MTTESGGAVPIHDAHIQYVLRLGDSALVLGQRLSEWCGHGPALEEDIALANIALDYIGQARLLLTHGARLLGGDGDEDTLAFLRDAGAFRNFTMLELPNGEPVSQGAEARDYGFTITRILLFSAWQCELWPALASSRDRELAAIAEKSIKESRYHLHHSADWVVRLGAGTVESHERMKHALSLLWPYTGELFSGDAVEAESVRAGIGAESALFRPGWLKVVAEVLDDATLSQPADGTYASTGKLGVHSEHLGHLLAEMQYLQRAYPGSQW